MEIILRFPYLENPGNAIGINIDGLPSGFEIDMEKLLWKWKEGLEKNPMSTAGEKDLQKY